MNCPNCGIPNADTSRFCTSCGARLAPPEGESATAGASDAPYTVTSPNVGFNTQDPNYGAGQYVPPMPNHASPYQNAQQQWQSAGEQVYSMTSTDEALRLANFVLCVISCVIGAIAVIPLAWLIPMTVHSWGIYKGKQPNTVCFGVCTLIFVSLVGGILLLISNKDK